MKDLGSEIKTKIGKVKSDLKNHDSHLDKILKKMRANAAKKKGGVADDLTNDADGGAEKLRKTKDKK